MTVPGAMLPLEEALQRMLAGLQPLPAEEVPLEEAVGRVLAAPVEAAVTMPPWDNSAMDGFAVHAADIAAAAPGHPVTLRVSGEVAAGHAPIGRVVSGTAMRVLTGAMLPPGADAVVPVEETDAAPGLAELPATVAVLAASPPGQHVRRAGSDIVAGQPLLRAGTRIRPATVALLASAGHARVVVHRRPRAAILSTGDELAPPGEPLGPGQIHDSNGLMLVALARQAGAEPRRLAPAADTLDAVLDRLSDARAWADLIIASGGVSVGARDVVRLAFEAIGRVDLWRVAVQPGKPLAFGHADGVLLFGLPGNPVSSYVTFQLFVRPVLYALEGQADPTRRRILRARLAEPVTKAADRRAFLRVSLARDPAVPDGWLARLAGGQGSHVLSALAAADGLAVVPEGQPGLPAGAEVDVWLTDREEA
ncbi:MAG: molybdopterin molybdotransferase MoeA [Candidatus Limnocylindrales bacterium]